MQHVRTGMQVYMFQLVYTYQFTCLLVYSKTSEHVYCSSLRVVFYGDSFLCSDSLQDLQFTCLLVYTFTGLHVNELTRLLVYVFGDFYMYRMI